MAKPTYKSTQFWITTAIIAFSGLVSAGILSKDQVDGLMALGDKVIGVGGAAVVAIHYNITRTKEKANELRAALQRLRNK